LFLRPAVQGTVFKSVDRGDVWVIERGEYLRLAFEAREPIGILRKRVRQNFDRHIAPEPRVARAIDLAHAARADEGDDVVRPETGAGR